MRCKFIDIFDRELVQAGTARHVSRAPCVALNESCKNKTYTTIDNIQIIARLQYILVHCHSLFMSALQIAVISVILHSCIVCFPISLFLSIPKDMIEIYSRLIPSFRSKLKTRLFASTRNSSIADHLVNSPRLLIRRNTLILCALQILNIETF